jgi:hypothetical protein
MLTAYPRFQAKCAALAAALGMEDAPPSEVHDALRIHVRDWSTSEAMTLEVALKGVALKGVALKGVPLK